jgi:predicted Rdx family selenoprotein
MANWQHPLILAAGLAGFILPAVADESTPPQSRRQMMKDCMAKQKASDGGMPKEEMKANCRDVTKPESENAKADKAATEAASPAKDGALPNK